jgi:hypothetical protein
MVNCARLSPGSALLNVITWRIRVRAIPEWRLTSEFRRLLHHVRFATCQQSDALATAADSRCDLAGSQPVIVGSTRSIRAPMPACSASTMAETTASCSVGASRSKKPRTVPSGFTEKAPSSAAMLGGGEELTVR